jgi:dihydrofolate reductase
LDDFNTGQDYGYHSFLESIDVLLMGRKTYEQILTFGDWPYPSKPCWVFSQKKRKSIHSKVSITNLPPEALLENLVKEGLTQSWLVGGANLIHYFRQKNLINEYILSIMPLLLGSGVPLFRDQKFESKLQTTRIKDYPNGVVQIHYRK